MRVSGHLKWVNRQARNLTHSPSWPRCKANINKSADNEESQQKWQKPKDMVGSMGMGYGNGVGNDDGWLAIGLL